MVSKLVQYCVAVVSFHSVVRLVSSVVVGRFYSMVQAFCLNLEAENSVQESVGMVLKWCARPGLI